MVKEGWVFWAQEAEGPGTCPDSGLTGAAWSLGKQLLSVN